MKHLILLPLLAINSLVLGAQDDVTITLTRTHEYCPCDGSTKLAEWQTWQGWTTSQYTISSSTTTVSTTTSSETTTTTSPTTTTTTSASTTTTSASTTTTSASTTTTSASTTTTSASTTTTSASTTTTSASTTTTSASTTTTSASTTATTVMTTTTSESTTTTSATTTTTTCADIGCGNPDATRSAFTSSGIVPTLIPGLDPKLDVGINYSGKTVYLGNEFTVLETTNQPDLVFNNEQGFDPDTTTYSYFLVDPDVPNPDSIARMNYLHWYVSGAKGLCATTPARNQQTVAIYQALSPASTQQHRYTFLVYREPAGYTPDLVAPNTRLGFDINTYAANGGLVLVGGNFLLEAVENGVISTTTTTPATTTTTTSEVDLPTL